MHRSATRAVEIVLCRRDEEVRCRFHACLARVVVSLPCALPQACRIQLYICRLCLVSSWWVMEFARFSIRALLVVFLRTVWQGSSREPWIFRHNSLCR